MNSGFKSPFEGLWFCTYVNEFCKTPTRKNVAKSSSRRKSSDWFSIKSESSWCQIESTYIWKGNIFDGSLDMYLWWHFTIPIAYGCGRAVVRTVPLVPDTREILRFYIKGPMKTVLLKPLYYIGRSCLDALVCLFAHFYMKIFC